MLFPTAPDFGPPPGQQKAPDKPRKPLTPKDSAALAEAQRSTTSVTLSRRALLFEIGAVLSLSYFVWLYAAISSMWWPSSFENFLDESVTYIVYSLQVSLPLLLILGRTGEPWSRFGIVRPKWFHDIMMGLVISAAVIFLRAVALTYFHILFADPRSTWGLGPEGKVPSTSFPLPAGLGQFALLFIGVLVGAFKQELVFRGYLIPRLRQLGTGVVPAILVSSALFASIHLYQGLLSACGHFFAGLVLGTVFLASGRLWPVVVAHTFLNLLVYLLADAAT